MRKSNESLEEFIGTSIGTVKHFGTIQEGDVGSWHSISWHLFRRPILDGSNKPICDGVEAVVGSKVIHNFKDNLPTVRKYNYPCT